MRVRYIPIALYFCLFAFPLVLVADDYYIQWADTIDNGSNDIAEGVAVDNSNNIIVTGYSSIDGNHDYFTVKYIPTPGVSEGEGSDILSNNPVLDDIYPNPFTTTTTIILSSSSSELQAASCKLNIYDVSGRLVRSVPLTTNHLTLGTDLSPGVYFLKADGFDVGKVVKISK